MRSVTALLIAVSLLAVACAEEQEVLEPIALEVVGEPSPPGVTPRGVYIVQDGLEVSPPAAPMHRIIYLNFDGGTYTPGSNNSSTNRSSIVSGTSTISPWGSASARQQVFECVQDIFSPFNITITTTDPGDVQHIEAVTAGRPQDIGMSSGVGGVSPFSCGIIERSIVFSFAEVYGGSYRSLCETVAQEAAHSFGLDHEYLCQDPMTYLNGCGAKSFQDTDAQCGEFSARNCQCGGSTQNSVEMLMAALGPSGPGVPPTVEITEPANGATVQAGFVVRVNATDDVGVERVELRVDGNLVETLVTQPYVFNAPATLSPGNHTVEARAYDSADGSTHSITVTVEDSGGGECSDVNPCPDGETCQGGTCVPDEPGDGEVGSPCENSSDCLSGICLSNGSDSYCTEFCDPAADSCPNGTECVPTTGDDAVCWPGSGGGGGDGDDLAGGCRVGAGSRGGAMTAWLLLAALLFVRRRRSDSGR